MDDRHTAEALQGPHREMTVPADFVPLRLYLQPGGLCVELTQPDMLVGRHSEADVRLALPDISRRHCRLAFVDGHWRVTDLNSLNGVFINDDRMHEATLHDGDRIRLGSLTFAVKVASVDPVHDRSVKEIPEVLSFRERQAS
jgi:pSer/pThr/pTyr-binding forkhead associated (FHA) protein